MMFIPLLINLYSFDNDFKLIKLEDSIVRLLKELMLIILTPGDNSKYLSE